MSDSAYLARRGPYAGFTTRFGRLMPPNTATGAQPLVFVTDGAPWIHHWITARYPHATHILDYYHVSEQLAAAARTASAPTGWLDHQQQHLLAGRSPCVEAAVQALDKLPDAPRHALLGYLKTNRARLR